MYKITTSRRHAERIFTSKARITQQRDWPYVTRRSRQTRKSSKNGQGAEGEKAHHIHTIELMRKLWASARHTIHPSYAQIADGLMIMYTHRVKRKISNERVIERTRTDICSLHMHTIVIEKSADVQTMPIYVYVYCIDEKRFICTIPSV